MAPLIAWRILLAVIICLVFTEKKSQMVCCILFFLFEIKSEKLVLYFVYRFLFCFVLLCVCVCVCVCENEKWKTKFEIQNRYPLDIRKLTIFWIFIRISWVKNESKYSVSNLFFNLSRKQNGTLDTRILLAPRYG